jgi:hypothetical protein
LNYFELFWKSKHYNTFQEQVTKADPVTMQLIGKHSRFLSSHGALPAQTMKMSHKLFINSFSMQGQIRYAIDYYEMISCLLVFTIILVALFPYINKTILSLSKKQPSPF